MRTLKVGSLVKVKTKEQISRLLKVFVNANGEIYDKMVYDTIPKEMVSKLGKIYQITKVNKNIHSQYIGISYYLDDGYKEFALNYYPRWLTPINTKAAKLLFKGKL